MNLFKKKKVEETGEKKDLKANYTTEDHKTDLDALLGSLNTHATQVHTYIGFWFWFLVQQTEHRGRTHTRPTKRA